MRYAANGYHEWADINNIRTIIWVIRAESNNAGFILGDDNLYHFHHNQGTPPTFWHGGHASANVRNGNLSINGFRGLDGTLVTFASQINEMSIVSLQTTGNVEASRFSDDRAISGRQWKGDLGELLIYTTALSDEQVESVEGYLAHKWGLAAKLPATHNYALGNAIDFHYVSNNPEIVEINGTSAIIRGGGTVTVTAHAPANHGANSATPFDMNITVAKAPLTITGQDLTLTVGNSIPDLNYTISGFKHSDASIGIGATPATMPTKLWLDASDSTTITHSSNAVSAWNDKSGNANHVAQSTADNQPITNVTTLNGLNVLDFDGTDWLIKSSTNVKNEDQTWLVVATIASDGVNSNGDSIFSYGNWVNGSFELRAGASSNPNFMGRVYKDGTAITTSESSTSALNGTTQMFAISFDRTNSKLSSWRNGTNFDNQVTDTRALTQDNKITIMAGRASNPSPIKGSIAELICITSVSTSDRLTMEGYLAHKWGLVSSLPSGHNHRVRSMSVGPIVTTDATNSSGAGTYYVRPSGALSNKYSFNYVDGQLILSNKTEQTIAWGQDFSSAGVGQTIDLNASASSNLAVLYSVSDTSVAELAVTNQSALKGWWKLDETSGVDASDSSAFSNTGSVENSTSGHYNAGKFGNAITLDGTNDHVRVYGYTGINGTAGRTVALWFKTSTANKPLLQYGTSGTGTLFKLSLNSSGAAVVDLGGATITSSTSGLANGAWHHLAVSFPSAANSGAAKLYVNGSGTNGSGTTTINTNTTKDIIIGRDGDAGSGYFNGQIDDVRFYDGEMNSTLIGQLYGNGNGDFNRLKIKTAGTVTLTASQPGDSSYAPAPSVTATATFNKSDQTISFDVIPDKSVGDFNFIPTAVASSGLDVSFTSSDSLVAEVQGDGRTIKIRSAGTATITANQAGDAAYNAATAVTQTLTVGYFNLQADSFPGIRLWLDGNNIDGDTTVDTTTNGTAIIQWIDQSGNTNHGGQATAGNRPTYGAAGLNSKGVINFTSGQSFDLSADANIRVIAAVIQQDSSQSSITKPFGGNQNLTTSAQKFSLGAIDSGVSSTSYKVVVWQMAPGAYSIHVDGTNKGSSTSSLSPAGFDKVGNDLAGSIAETVAYDRALSDGVRQKLEGYLAHKWGLVSALPSAHNYKVAKPAFGGAQILTFQPVSDKQVGQAATLTISADSGLTTFTFDSNDSTVASFGGNATDGYTVTGLKEGKVTITATQPGQTPWNSATATQPFIVTSAPRQDQNITFADIPDKNVLSSNFSLDANASSGLPVSFESLHPLIATVDVNGTVTIVGQGVATIRATQDGNNSYNAAPSVEKTLTVTKVPQTITFNALTDASLFAGTYSLSGKATASSGLAVSFASSDATVASLSGTTLTLHKGGTVTITANQSGNDTYQAAPAQTQSLTVKDDRYFDQNITWTQTIPALSIGGADTNMTAKSIDADTGLDTNLTISYTSSDTAVVSIVNGNYLRIVGAGSATITASQGGNVDTGGRYNAATSVTKNVTVGKANQSIVTNAGATTLPNLTKDNGDFPFAPSIKSVDSNGSDTGLTLSYATSNASIVSVNGINLAPAGVGTATITVSQAGDTNYNAATSKTFTITVTEKSPYSDSVAGLVMWLDGKDVNGDRLAESASDFLTGGKVGSWADRSGNANTLTQATTGNQPTYSTGGGLDFASGGNMGGALPNSLTGNPGFTAIIVADATSTAKDLLTIGNGSGSAHAILLKDNGSINYDFSSSITQAGSYNFYTAKSVGVWRKKSGSNFDKGEFKLNGSDKGLTLSGSADATGFSVVTNSSGLVLGHASAGITGTVYEVLLYASDLPDYTIKRMEGYLAHKWGSAANLPSGHPFKSSAPDFGGSQTIVTSGNTIPVVSSTPTLSIDIGLFRLEDYGCYATSGLPLSYATSNASVIAVDATTGKLDPKGAGSATITISQAGDSHFSAASNVTLTIAISEDRSQTIDFPAIPDQNASSSAQNITLNATASSGLAVTYASSDTNIATISGSTLTIAANALGTVTITASQSGGVDPSNSNLTYLAAEDVSHTFSVAKADQFITFAALPDRNNSSDGQTFTLSATASSGGTVTFESNNTAIVSLSGDRNQTATVNGEGPVTITASTPATSTYNAASKSRSFNAIKDTQYITFAAIADTNTSVSSISASATASSGLAVVFESNDTSIITVSGSTLNIQGAGNVTITARQPGNYAYRAAIPETRTFFVKLVGRPLQVIFDGGGTMGTNESFKARVTLKDGTTGKLIDPTKYTSISRSFSVTNSVTGTTNASVSGNTVSTGTGSGSFTVTVSVSDSNSITAKRYVPKTASITVTVDSSKSGQTILVHDGGSGGFGLVDLPLSRKPIAIGKMFKASSGQDITFTIASDPQKIIDQTKSVLSGAGAKLVFNQKSSNSGADGKFKGFEGAKEISFEITASQAGNGSYHAAQSVSRTVKIKKPSKSVFFEERKQDARYDDVKNAALSRMGISGEKATALFDSDNYDSDGDGVSNLLERAFGGDSLGNDSRENRPAPVKTSDGKEYLSFTRYTSDFQSDMGITYIVEKSSDRRTWTTTGVEQVTSATTDLGGGMERVVYRTTAATSAGSTQFIRVRVKAR